MICACCKERPKGRTYAVAGVMLCAVCFVGWERSAARAVVLKESEPNLLPALQQYIGGKSCAHNIGMQRPEALPWP